MLQNRLILSQITKPLHQVTPNECFSHFFKKSICLCTKVSLLMKPQLRVKLSSLLSSFLLWRQDKNPLLCSLMFQAHSWKQRWNDEQKEQGIVQLHVFIRKDTFCCSSLKTAFIGRPAGCEEARCWSFSSRWKINSYSCEQIVSALQGRRGRKRRKRLWKLSSLCFSQKRLGLFGFVGAPKTKLPLKSSWWRDGRGGV